MDPQQKTVSSACEMDDVMLIRKYNNILKFLNENVLVQDTVLIKEAIDKANAALINAWLNEPLQPLSNFPEKTKARSALRFQIDRFEEFIKAESDEILLTYQQCIN